MPRAHNLNPGPAALPVQVLEEVQAELVDYAGNGLSVLEMSHRAPSFIEIYEKAEETLRDVLGIPGDYDVLFLSGGATLEFAALAMNLMRTGRAGYVVSGHFSKVAMDEGARYGEAVCLATGEGSNFSAIPTKAEIDSAIVAEVAAGGLDYVHICQNNTIYGTMFHELPETDDVPLVADVSSCFLSLPLDVERYGVIYAGAQKNAGPAGVTVVICRHDLIAQGPALGICPAYLDWRSQAMKQSMLNTPNTFGIYVCGKVFEWVKEMGGLEAMEARNRKKASMLYDVLDQSKLFRGVARPQDRSIANVTFTTNIPELDREFVSEAARAGLVGLGGHRLVGGMRASIYNSVPKASVERLCGLMKEFEELHAGSSSTE